MCALIVVVLLAGCSVGPQIPNTVPVVNVTCNIRATDGGCTADGACTCHIDRSWAEAKPLTTGNRIDEANIDADVRAPITVERGEEAPPSE